MEEQVENRISDVLQKTKLTFAAQLLGGSELFGYSQDTSDRDIRVIGIPDKNCFLPASRGLVVGFDNMLSPFFNTITNVKVQHLNGEKKYDIFIDGIQHYLALCLRGSYFELQNLLTPLEKYDRYDLKWPAFKESLCNNIPETVYSMAALNLVRDMRGVLFKFNKAESGFSKKITQMTFIKNFILTRNPLDNSIDYLELRQRSLTKGQALDAIGAIELELKNYVATHPFRATEQQIGSFRKSMMVGLNTWYGEDVFTIPQ